LGVQGRGGIERAWGQIGRMRNVREEIAARNRSERHGVTGMSERHGVKGRSERHRSERHRSERHESGNGTESNTHFEVCKSASLQLEPLLLLFRNIL